MKNRVKEIRLRKGWSLEKLAEVTGLSRGQLSRIENEKRGWSVSSLETIADALGVTIQELLETTGAWQDVPIFGAVEEAGAVRPCGDGSKSKKPSRVRAPAAYGELLALRVTSNGLYPRYNKGDTIFCTKSTVDPADCIGKECFVWLEHGESLIRFVHLGAIPRHYNLMAHNQPPLTDVALVACHPVIRPGQALD